jgi:hypothetical protein
VTVKKGGFGNGIDKKQQDDKRPGVVKGMIPEHINVVAGSVIQALAGYYQRDGNGRENNKIPNVETLWRVAHVSILPLSIRLNDLSRLTGNWEGYKRQVRYFGRFSRGAGAEKEMRCFIFD